MSGRNRKQNRRGQTKANRRMPPKTLLIAPDSGLENVSSEIRSISASLQATVLSDVVSRKDVIDAIGDKEWDIVWFATHGDVVGIELSDGILEISSLISIVRNTSASLLVLNTCSGKAIGLELNHELGIDVICVEGEVGDYEAYQFGRFLAQNIKSGLSFRMAFDRARPGQDSRYYYLTQERSSKPSYDARIDDERTIKLMHQVIDELDKKMERRIGRVEESLRSEIERLSASVNNLNDTISKAVVLKPIHRYVYWFAWLFLYAPLPLFVEEFRMMMHVGWQFTILFASVSYALSAILFIYMWWGESYWL